VSRPLLEDIQTLLLAFGIVGRIKYYKGNKTGWKERVPGIGSLYVYHSEDIKKFWKEIGIAKDPEHIFDRPIDYKAHNQFTKCREKMILWDEIVSIEKVPSDGFVYDISTENETFIASNIVLHNTEGGALLTIALWKENFEKRFDYKYNVAEAYFDGLNWKYCNLKNNKFDNTLIVVTVRDIFKLFSLHGTPIDFKITEEGGRIDVKRLKPDSLDVYVGEKKVTSEELPIESTPIGKLLSETRACGIIYDSLLELFKQRIPSTRENFPSRGYLLHNLLGCMQRIAETYSIPVVGIAHTSRDPADPNKKREKLNAETIISFNCKFITLFRTLSDSLTDYRREVTIWRHQSKAPLSESFIIYPSDKGIDEEKKK
jgi:hypothetical protein